jgi:leucyl-tRNA synthetase
LMNIRWLSLMLYLRKTIKTLHKTIKKVADDIENFSFNTSVSQFMICVNELSTKGCHSRLFLNHAIVISPYITCWGVWIYWEIQVLLQLFHSLL